MNKERRKKLAEIFNIDKVEIRALVHICDKLALYEQYDEDFVMNKDFECYRNVVADMAMELCGYTYDQKSRRYVESSR